MHTVTRIVSGTLALVVGPSGAGKDTLIDTARAELATDESFYFARRVVTRQSHDASEQHDAMTPEAFDRAEVEGAFLLSWRAHGLGYAIPDAARQALRASRVVVANVSRGSIADAEQLVERVVVLHVTAPVSVLAQRIANRGREPFEAIASRLQRQAPLTANRARIIDIVNDGTIEDAARLFTDALRSLQAPSEDSAR
jgi:phosphonate metabolism protein PhnN/1,5-bisphosphokinase (PRPP-forming)